jgi:Flp pilus assembly pilin Flp
MSRILPEPDFRFAVAIITVVKGLGTNLKTTFSSVSSALK